MDLYDFKRKTAKTFPTWRVAWSSVCLPHGTRRQPLDAWRVEPVEPRVLGRGRPGEEMGAPDGDCEDRASVVGDV